MAENTGTYTAMDYADIMEHLVGRWNVKNLTGLNGDAAAMQEYVIKLPDRIRKLAEKATGAQEGEGGGVGGKGGGRGLAKSAGRMEEGDCKE